MGFPGGSEGKASVCDAGEPGSIPGSGRSLGEGNGNPPSILTWEISWTEQPSGLLHLMQRATSLEKTLMLGKIEGQREEDGRG